MSVSSLRHSFEANQDVIAGAAEDGQRGHTWLDAAQKLEHATVARHPRLKIRGGYRDTDAADRAKLEVWGELATELAEFGVVHGERLPVQRGLRAPFAATQSLPWLTAEHVVEDLDQAITGRKAQHQLASWSHQLGKVGRERREVAYAVQSGEI
jgi:hypothetical protein